MGQLAQNPRLKTVVASAAVTATASSDAFDLTLGDTYQLTLNITAASGTSPTLDVVLQSALDGTNYVNLPLRFTQKTTTGVAHLVFKLGLGGNEVALEQAAADTGGTLAKNCIFNPKLMKLKYTVGGTNPSFTFAVIGGSVPAGFRSNI